ncbi:MAG: GGDEF domain-containing protein [Candidatus Omnitrophica bacterium]|nr:GGDEF domain-containing protein [Candidatus Omnitrophota bacterium]
MNKLLMPPLVIVFLFLFVLVLGYIDYVTSPLPLMIFYLIPVALAVWLVGRWASLVILATSALVWFFGNNAKTSLYSRHLIIYYYDLAANIAFFLIFIYILYKLKEAFKREQLFARIDYLTGVSNRKNFFDLAAREISRAARYKYQLTVMYIDLDDFKRINDSFGHKAGDELLCVFSRTLQESVRLSDIVARLGGDEFVVLFPETGCEAAKITIQRIKEKLLKTLQQNRWDITFSIGAVTCVHPACDFDTIMALADTLMYSAKKSGKNGIKYEVLGGDNKVCGPSGPDAK